MSNKITTDLLEFIENSPSCFHAVQTTKEILTKHGFTELSEDQFICISCRKLDWIDVTIIQHI